jgi:hypothetical protein
VKEDMSEEHVEERASIHTEDVGRKENQKKTYDTSSEISNEDDGISVLDGYTFDESTQEEDSICYDDMFQLVDVEGPTYLTIYDDGSQSVIALPIDVDSSPYLSYVVDDDEEVIVPRQGLEDQLLVKEEKIAQVLTRADDTHKFIKYLMWKY